MQARFAGYAADAAGCHAGIAVAMGNGEEEVKSIADYITSDNDHDGVGEAVEKFVLKV